jgi:iron(III) transport system ATP-binding protein
VSALRFEGVGFGYTRGAATLDNFSLTLEPGELGCLLGPSGCGKSTALKLAAGFIAPSAGTIDVNGVRVAAVRHNVVPPEQRGLGMVFQDHALFPHLRVRDNVGFGLHRATRDERAKRIAEMLERVGISDLADRYPAELSGGQQQRVALARALAPGAKLLLLDEPFSSLDGSLRTRLAREVRDLLRERGLSALLVTHDLDEAFAFADRVALMRAGRIEQCGAPYALYHEPINRFVAGFVGEGVLIAGERCADGRVRTPLGEFPMNRDDAERALEVLLRPDDFTADANGLPFVVRDRAFRGAETLYRLRHAEIDVLALVPSHLDVAVGSVLKLRPTPQHVVTFPRNVGS